MLRAPLRNSPDSGWPAWSPDSKQIAFATTRDDCSHSQAPNCRTTGDIGPFDDIWLMNADGSNQHRLADKFGQFAVWSPDGQYILFSPGLNVIRPDGSGLASILVGGIPGDIEFPDWTR